VHTLLDCLNGLMDCLLDFCVHVSLSFFLLVLVCFLLVLFTSRLSSQITALVIGLLSDSCASLDVSIILAWFHVLGYTGIFYKFLSAHIFIVLYCIVSARVRGCACMFDVMTQLWLL